jgi:acetylornithine deacetylase/succinyl-diaminopimelate desuccinylase-like protein
MRLGRLLQSLDKKRLPVHVTSQLRRMMVATADALPTHLRIASRAVLWPRFTNRILAVLKKDAAPLDVLLHNTATPIAVDSGKKTGEVPTEITVDFDGRVLPGQTPADLVHELKTLVGDLADFEVVNEEPAVRAESDLTLYPMLAEIIRRHDPGGIPIPALIPGYTDARHFAQLGIQTYGFTPMRLPKHITLDLIHAPDERVPAEAIVFGILYDPGTQRPVYTTLPYGKVWRRGPFTCASRLAGVTCTNTRGHGLFLSRQSWRVS